MVPPVLLPPSVTFFWLLICYIRCCACGFQSLTPHYYILSLRVTVLTSFSTMSTQTETDDLSLPIATLLRTRTAAVHDKVEKSQGAAWLARGELDRDEYIRFLMILWHVYECDLHLPSLHMCHSQSHCSTLECALEEHASHPVLSFTYNPTLLSRATKLSADISYLLQTNDTAWRSHPMHISLMDSAPSALTRYVSRIQSVAQSPDPSPLLAHAYVRYLGDISGGQIIRSRIVKAYGLDDGSGAAFYDFNSLGGTGVARMGDLKKIKEWYRHNMDTSVGDDVTLKGEPSQCLQTSLSSI